MSLHLCSIDPRAKIGSGVQFGPFVTIYEDVEIGDDCWIGPNVTIMNGARIGKGVKIFPGAVISAEPQDLKYKNEPTVALIGDHTTIRECVTINRGTAWSGKTVIGSQCLIMAYSHVAHDCVIGNNCVIANNAALAGHIVIEDYAVLGGITAVHQFVKIGRHAFISGGSLVRKDVPPFVKAAKEPLSYMGVNTVGLRRRGYAEATINQIEDIYRIIFIKNHNVSKAVSVVEAEVAPSAERDLIIDFIRKSERGILKGYTNGRYDHFN
ncbi:MAG: acyl-ACP--UDP-N-acetylglucosamine O-acyltransferase [Chitinophagales bacterium]|nr:acyl-ACP--UDP-N-acetylglucosamine O-acyltransferase [Chitinophagales bacterium]MDW8394329.1 acyl-ACP--UDP-N-acetylglucosamine O-acyltransferase [Chitinophagales bacterium]